MPPTDAFTEKTEVGSEEVCEPRIEGSYNLRKKHTKNRRVRGGGGGYREDGCV